MRLGGTENIKVDVRIVAASNVDLLGLVRDGRFREDLYHRLNVIALKLPPLRERREDIPSLVDHFLQQFSKENNRLLGRFTREAMKLLMDYHWPGNVRELENVVERAVVLSAHEEIDVDLLPEPILTRGMLGDARLQLSDLLNSLAKESNQRAAAGQTAPSLFGIMEQIERRVIIDMLEQTGWNQTEAAERFQVPLSTLNQKIKRLGIELRRRSIGVPATR
jgi:DNA-binding NtrC family response regulator